MAKKCEARSHKHQDKMQPAREKKRDMKNDRDMNQYWHLILDGFFSLSWTVVIVFECISIIRTVYWFKTLHYSRLSATTKYVFSFTLLCAPSNNKKKNEN